MSCPNPSNYQNVVNQHSEHGGGGLGIDFEEATSSNLSKMIQDATDSNNTKKTLEIEIDIVEHCDAAAANARIYNNFGGIAVLPKKAGFLLAAFVLLGTGGIIGFGLSGVIEHKRQQQHRRMDTLPYRLREHDISTAEVKANGGGGGKAGKVCLNDHDPIDDEEEFCAEEQVIECGATFTNEVVLSHDLICSDYINDATDEQKRAHNAAITLTGPNASIDCKGHTIRQIIQHEFTIQSCYIGQLWPPLEPSDDRKHIKEVCRFFYQSGILLVDGATAVNCNVENFYDGYHIVNGGEVKKSESSGNQWGVNIQDLTGTTESKVTDV